MSVYGDATQAKDLKNGFETAGKKLDMGKACVHFHAAKDLALEVLARIVSAVSMEKWVAIAKSARRPNTKTRRTNS